MTDSAANMAVEWSGIPILTLGTGRPSLRSPLWLTIKPTALSLTHRNSLPKPTPPPSPHLHSPYHVTKADLGEEESPLPADHSRRPRDWLRSMRTR